MLVVRCDRCGEEDNIHARALDITLVSPLRTMDMTEETIHLCGYCFSRVKQLIGSPDR